MDMSYGVAVPGQGVPSDPFRRFQYLTLPLGVSDEYRNRLLTRALREGHEELCEEEP
jgi:hypothetical protein